MTIFSKFQGLLEQGTLWVYLPSKDEPDWDNYFWKTQSYFLILSFIHQGIKIILECIFFANIEVLKIRCHLYSQESSITDV